MSYPSAEQKSGAAPWKILIVDDDADVHVVTRLALRDLVFRGRGLEFVDAYSGAEAVRCLDEHPDIAVAFVDVIMETDDAGLGSVKKIRENGHHLVRLIVRTGHPGQAPEHEVVVNYDIHDYKDKSTVTKQKLVTSLISALRAYDDLVSLETHRRGLMGVLESVSWFDFANVQRYVAGMLAEFSQLAHLHTEQTLIVARMDARQPPEVVALNGDWADLVDGDFTPFIALPAPVAALVTQSLEARSGVDSPLGSTMMVSGHGVDLVAYAEGEGVFARVDRLLLEVFLLKVCQAVANQHVYQSVVNQRDALVTGIALYAERWDRNADANLQSLARLSRKVAQRLQVTLAFGDAIDSDFVQHIGAAARLHDLGNLYLPMALLEKAGEFTTEERQQMQGHVAAGRALMAPWREQAAYAGLFELADEVIAGHHEHYDGSGYPQGLAGEAIPLAGRVVAVVDAWVAMTADRPQRAALSDDAAKAQLREGAGKRFDPRVVDALLCVLEPAL